MTDFDHAEAHLTDDQIFDLLACIADEEIMVRNRKSIVDAGRALLAAAPTLPAAQEKEA